MQPLAEEDDDGESDEGEALEAVLAGMALDDLTEDQAEAFAVAVQTR